MHIIVYYASNHNGCTVYSAQLSSVEETRLEDAVCEALIHDCTSDGFFIPTDEVAIEKITNITREMFGKDVDVTVEIDEHST